MKCGVAFFSGLVVFASAGDFEKLHVQDFKADSEAAKKLFAMSQVDRKLEDGWYFDEAFVAQHSIIYEACYNETGWTDEGYMQQTLVRYTLCPTDSCSDGSCSSSYYGEYVVDLETFLDAYMESKLESIRYKCETMREVCGCDEDNNGCLYYCYKNYDDDSFDWQFCAEEQGEEERYAECQKLEIKNDDERDRALKQRMAEYEFYVGPFCAADGQSINLAIYTDEDCQYEHYNGEYVYELLSGGDSLPYSDSSLIKNECVSCLEEQREEEQNDDDYQDPDEVSRFCEETYNVAARCETNLNTNYYKDESGCQLIANLESGEYSGWAAYYQLNFSGSNTLYAALFGGVLAVFSIGAYVYAKKKSGTDEKEQELVGENQYNLS